MYKRFVYNIIFVYVINYSELFFVIIDLWSIFLIIIIITKKKLLLFFFNFLYICIFLIL